MTVIVRGYCPTWILKPKEVIYVRTRFKIQSKSIDTILFEAWGVRIAVDRFGPMFKLLSSQ